MLCAGSFFSANLILAIHFKIRLGLILRLSLFGLRIAFGVLCFVFCVWRFEFCVLNSAFDLSSAFASLALVFSLLFVSSFLHVSLFLRLFNLYFKDCRLTNI